MARAWDKSKPPRGPWVLNKDSPLARGLVAWLPFGGVTGGGSGNGEVQDYSELGLVAGSTTPNPNWTLDGWGGPALKFNGSSDFVDCGTPASLNLAADYTIIIRINLDTTGGGVRAIFAQGDAGLSQVQFSLNVNRTAGKLEMLSDNGHIAVTGSTALSAAKWNQVAATVSGTTYTLYIDGVQDATAVDATARQAQKSTSIGDLGASANYFFTGQVGEIAVYNRALSATDVAYAHDLSNRFELWRPLRSHRGVPAAAAATAFNFYPSGLSSVGGSGAGSKANLPAGLGYMG